MLAKLGVAASLTETEEGHRIIVQAPPGRDYTLVPIWAAEGYPADVDWALSQLADLKLSKSLIPVIAARALSSGSIERLDRAGLSWVDETGRTRIAAPPGLLLVRT